MVVNQSHVTFVVGGLSQYMQSSYRLHSAAACFIWQYFKRPSSKELLLSSHLDICGLF